ncbi:hypothetical protein NPIL_386891 [Nephila pilipes]|uniref:Uncharacterized protein n=1 Tax=Nephila pilipes TaxID=299642 RepID=A0A8X6Q1K3_NEPPI|nr:hypothetical protein NPIL_386891 [Nephila pilipes]
MLNGFGKTDKCDSNDRNNSVLSLHVNSSCISDLGSLDSLDRVREATIFEIIGIDLAGPMLVKNNAKIWVVIFTCAVFRAVHLELTPNLSTESVANGSTSPTNEEQRMLTRDDDILISIFIFCNLRECRIVVVFVGKRIYLQRPKQLPLLSHSAGRRCHRLFPREDQRSWTWRRNSLNPPGRIMKLVLKD